MPLIPTHHEQSVKHLVEVFYKETRLILKVFLDNKEISNSNSAITQIWKQHPILSNFDFYHFQNDTEFLPITQRNTIGSIKRKMGKILGFEFKIFDFQHELSDDAMLSEIIKFKKDERIVKKLNELNLNLRKVTKILEQERQKSIYLFSQINLKWEKEMIIDYEPEYFLSFYLHPKDYLFNIDLDNELFRIRSTMPYSPAVKLHNADFDSLERENREDVTGVKNNSNGQYDKIENQYALFYCLCQYVSLQDIARIGSIWFDYHHVHQWNLVI